MTKLSWNESMNMFRDHVDPEKEEQRKQVIIETDAKVEKLVKLVKSESSDNKEEKQTEVISLIEDFYKQYQSMCALYEDLREVVKKKCNDEEDKEGNGEEDKGGNDEENKEGNDEENKEGNGEEDKEGNDEEDKEDNESNSSSKSLGMQSAGYYSPGSGTRTPNNDQPRAMPTDGQSMKSENSCNALEALNAESCSTVEKLVKETNSLRDHLSENNKSPLQMKVLEDTVLALKLDIEACQKSDKVFDDKSEESVDRVQNLEMEVGSLTEQLKEKTSNEEGLVEERDSLKEQVKGLEVKIESISNENPLSKDENKDQVSAEDVKDLSDKMKSLKQRFESLETAPTPDQRDMHLLVNKSNPCGIQATVKKMGEMVDEFRKKSEDSVRILNRRICVVEQLHNENRDWYKKSRDQQEQEKKDNELAFYNIKTIVSMVNETLSVSERFGLRFAECCEEFTNRVSKVSCEINFVKDCVRRKNDDLVKAKEDSDALVIQLGDKEGEILSSRQKALKLGSKLRELKKIVKENDEAMIVLKEEKREAIRQLCVWIDYHRSRSDFLKKAFFELVARCQRLG